MLVDITPITCFWREAKAAAVVIRYTQPNNKGNGRKTHNDTDNFLTPVKCARMIARHKLWARLMVDIHFRRAADA